MKKERDEIEIVLLYTFWLCVITLIVIIGGLIYISIKY